MIRVIVSASLIERDLETHKKIHTGEKPNTTLFKSIKSRS